MDLFLLYLLKVSTGIMIFYLCYLLFFNSDTFYMRNRIYLLMSLVLSFLIPLLKTPGFSAGNGVIQPVIKLNDIIISGAVAEITITEKISTFNLTYLIFWFYSAIAGLLLLRLLISVSKTYSIIRKGTLHTTSIPKVILSDLKYPPFSFFPL